MRTFDVFDLNVVTNTKTGKEGRTAVIFRTDDEEFAFTLKDSTSRWLYHALKRSLKVRELK